MNHLSVERPEGEALAPIDPERRALEMRIEHAKRRIAEDFERASALVRNVARRTGRGLGALVVASALVITGIVVAALVRRSRPRVRWR